MYYFKTNPATVEDHFPSILKIHGNLCAYIGLNLSYPPVRLQGMPDQGAGL